MQAAAPQGKESLGPGMPVLIGAGVMLAMAMGLRQSLGIFMTPMTADIAVSISEFTLAIAIQNLIWGLSQPLVGALAVRVGFRIPMVAGGVLFCLGLGLLVMADGFLMVLLGAGVAIGIAMSATSSAMAMAVTSRAVPASRRSLMLGLVGSASSLGAMLAAPVGQWLNTSQGDWRIGMIGFVLMGLSIIPAAWFAGRVDRTPLHRHAATGSDGLGAFAALRVALRHGPFLVMSAAFFVCGMQLVFLLTHLPNYLAICGMDPMLSATALGIIGAFNVAGSIFFGWMGGRFSKQALLGIMYMCRSAILTWFFMTPPTPESVILFSGLMGFFWLGVSPLIAGSVIEMFGLKWQPMIQGITFFVHQFGSFAGAFGGGYVYDAMGSYDLAWRVGVIVGATAGVVQLAVALWRPPAAPRLKPA